MRRSEKYALSLFIGTLLALLPLQATGQSLAAQPQHQSTQRNQPIPLPHLYWHFLIHQSILDAREANLQSQGKDDNGLHNDLQQKLGFSDADYFPIRVSAQRLSSELKELGTEARGMQSPLHPRLDRDQIKNLTDRQEADIDQEVLYLTEQLTPQNKARLDAFLPQFFAPRPLSVKIAPSTTSGKEAK